MKLKLGSFYASPGFHFDISHKVYLQIEKMLNANVLIPYGLNLLDGDMILRLDASTGPTTEKVEIYGPSHDRNHNVKSYGLFLPYNEVSMADDLLEKFIDEFFIGITMVLIKYNVSSEDVSKVKQMAKSEILGNEDYFFDEEVLPPIDLSDLDL